jgi:hypothetical protein
MPKQSFSLHCQMVNGIVHTSKTSFSSSNQILISDNFINDLLL